MRARHRTSRSSARRPAALAITHFVFDLDGTLTDTWPVALAAFKETLREHAGVAPGDAELIAMAGPSEEGILRRLRPDDWEDCFQGYLRRFAEILDGRNVLLPGIGDLLADLDHRGKIMAVNSGKTRAAVEMVLTQTGIAPYFTRVEGGSAEGDVKHERLEAFARFFAVPPSAVAFVGDSCADMAAARSSGVLGIGAAWASVSGAGELGAAGADIVFGDVSVFRQWLAG